MNNPINDIYKPLLFRLKNLIDKGNLKDLIKSDNSITIYDNIEEQLKELIKCLNPSLKISQEEYPDMINEHLNGISIEDYGVWVYYEWSKKLVHLLEEDEFIEVRTNRNQYKITREEQDLLSRKKIGIVGLSVGQSIALTMAIERTCGELRLADFDTAELSNLNRLRTGVHNLGLRKTIIAAREILEIDPFLEIKIFNEGLHKKNMDDFFTNDGKLDLFIEVCDGLDIKIESRFKARELGIPVIMDTNDRGMLDVERFDLEPNRAILHGLVGNIDTDKVAMLTNEEKIPIVLQIASAKNVSMRGKASMVEVGQSISTWPQVASSVVLGGAVTTDVARRLLLGQFNSSGRYYVDIDKIIGDEQDVNLKVIDENPYSPLTKDDMEKLIFELSDTLKPEQAISLSKEQLTKIVNAGIAAPSTGNDQPWKWFYKNNVLYLFHDKQRSYSFGDYKNIASYLTFGAVYENIVLEAHNLSLEVSTKLFPLENDEPLICAFFFTDKILTISESHQNDGLEKFIYKRCTNRNLSSYKKIDETILSELKRITETVSGAELNLITDKDKIANIGNIVGACDKIRILHPKGHNDFVNREMRWSGEDAEISKDGIDVQTLGLNESQIAALGIIKNYDVIDFIKTIKGGKVLKAAAVKSINCASAIGLVTMPETNNLQEYIYGGRAYERLWLAAEKHDLALHPIISPLYLFSRVNKSDGDLSLQDVKELEALKEEFFNLFNLKEGVTNIFLFKLSYADRPDIRSLRIPIEKVLFTN